MEQQNRIQFTRDKFTLVITHKNCADGALAGAILANEHDIGLDHVFGLGHSQTSEEEIKYLESIGFFSKLDELVDAVKYVYSRDNDIDDNDPYAEQHREMPEEPWSVLDTVEIIVTDHGLHQDTLLYLFDKYNDGNGGYYITLVNIDHHATTQKGYSQLNPKLEELKENGWFDFHFSNQFSGAALAWMFVAYGFSDIFNEVTTSVLSQERVDEINQRLPRLVQYVQARDIWTWVNHPERDNIEAFGIMHMIDGVTPEGIHRNYDVDDLKGSANNHMINTFISQGESVIAYRQRLIDSAKKDVQPIYVREIVSSNHKENGAGLDVFRLVNGAFVTTHLSLSSDLGNQLVNLKSDDNQYLYDFAIIANRAYTEDGKVRYEFSVRSRDDFDSSIISKHFGGGGHKQASGFKVTTSLSDGFSLDTWLYSNFVDPLSQLVLNA